MGHEEFSVYQFFVDGSYERVRSFVSAENAVKAAMHYTNNVAVKMGVTVRVIITDGGDCTVFEWKKGEGVVFPEKLDGQTDEEVVSDKKAVEAERRQPKGAEGEIPKPEDRTRTGQPSTKKNAKPSKD